ncbi:unnamed protein product [Amoebophrya sp. A25]|nr:unnamed protein product [Amoebophrya sp. A25]|eukprot:GSA25T00023979001.1
MNRMKRSTSRFRSLVHQSVVSNLEGQGQQCGSSTSSSKPAAGAVVLLRGQELQWPAITRRNTRAPTAIAEQCRQGACRSICSISARRLFPRLHHHRHESNRSKHRTEIKAARQSDERAEKRREQELAIKDPDVFKRQGGGGHRAVVVQRSRFELPEAPASRNRRPKASSRRASLLPERAQQRSVGDVTDSEIRAIFPADDLAKIRPAPKQLVKRPHLWIQEEGERYGRTSEEDELACFSDEGDEGDVGSIEAEMEACKNELKRIEEDGEQEGRGGGSTCSRSGDYLSTSSTTSLSSEERRDLLENQDAGPASTGTLKLSDVGRFQRFSRDDLLELLPEGLSGELSRDVILVPSQTRPIGFMLRKATMEILSQMEYLRKNPAAMASRPGWLLEGKKGCGKSAVLNHIVAMARRSGWLVIFEPFPANYAKEIGEIARSSGSGIYVQNAQARRFLERTQIKNHEMFEQIDVDYTIYGERRSVDGERSQPKTGRIPELYNDLIAKAVEKDLEAEEAGGAFSSSLTQRRQRLSLWHEYRREVELPSMRKKLPNPSTLGDIVQFGIDNETWATQAVAELFEQLKVQEKFPLLIAVDEWNECFPVSDYVSVRYDGTRFGGYIPAYHLSMPRNFVPFDGCKYKRGLKLYATSWYRMNRRDWKPELLQVRPENVKQIREFSPDEFASYCAYCRLQNITHNFPREKLEYFWMLTQGNGWQARRILSTLY